MCGYFKCKPDRPMCVMYVLLCHCTAQRPTESSSRYGEYKCTVISKSKKKIGRQPTTLNNAGTLFMCIICILVLIRKE